MFLSRIAVKNLFVAILSFSVIVLTSSCASISKSGVNSDLTQLVNDDMTHDNNAEDFGNEGFDEFDDTFEESADSKKDTINDPLEPFNRVMFKFNDKFYFWLFKPVTQGYRFVIPKVGRVALRRFFSNLSTPGRFVNSILQLKLKSAGIELSRLVINSTIGIAGFMDPARKFKLYKQDEDFGQTLGYYGVGHGFYLNLPFFGPLTLRSSVGMAGGIFLEPITYISYIGSLEKIGISVHKNVNETSLNINLYDDLVHKAFDPYVFMKNAYYQIRENKVKE